MRCFVPALACVVVLLPSMALSAALATGPQPLSTKITAVTVFADRAEVTRSGSLLLEGKTQQVVIDDLPGWIDPGSVRAVLTPATNAELLDVTVEQHFLVKPGDPEVQAAKLALQKVSDRLDDLGDEEAVLRAEVAQLEAVRAFSLEKLPRDMATHETGVKTFAETLDLISGRLRRARIALRKIARTRRELSPERTARIRARDALQARTQLQRQSVHLTLKGKGKATLRLTYLTSGATWEPVGELRASKGGKKVSLLQAASVVQTTGEKWEGASLTFSTQLPGQTLAVPEVQALLLGGDGAGLGVALERANASFEKARTDYFAMNALQNQANPEWQQQLARQQQVQARATATFRSLAARGTTAHYEARAQRTVRSDGKAVRVPIASAGFTAVVKLVAVPEVSLNVIRTAALTNTSGQSILPGRASLYVDGAFMGNSELPFVAPRESFSTFLGVHEGVKLERSIDRERSSIDRGRRRTTVTASFLISAENLGVAPVTLEVGDRIPVPQEDDLEIDDVELPRGATRNPDGVVKWMATLAPGKKTVWRVEYTLEYPNDFLSRGRPAAAQAPKKRMLYDQLRSIESSM